MPCQEPGPSLGQGRRPAFPYGRVGGQTLMRLFEAMPAATGCSFLVVMHLLADREGMLATLIGRKTKMSVAQARQDMLLAPNHVYIAPPGLHIELDRGRIVLQPIAACSLRPSGPIGTLPQELGQPSRETAKAIESTLEATS